MRFSVFISFFLLCGLAQSQPSSGNDFRFSKGEEIALKLSYGWFTVGKAKINVRKSDWSGKACLKVDVEGSSAGILNFFAKVDDEWSSSISRESFLPFHASRNISEGRYKLQEEVFFDYNRQEIRVETFKAHDTPKRKPTRYYELKEGVAYYDLLGGLLKIRMIDFASLRKGDYITMSGFYEDTFYDFRIVYEGTEWIKTKLGKLKAHKVLPLMPKNSVFNEKRSITMWISADARRLPLKVAASMFIGKVGCEIISYNHIGD